jgi:hypothetical protein
MLIRSYCKLGANITIGYDHAEFLSVNIFVVLGEGRDDICNPAFYRLDTSFVGCSNPFHVSSLSLLAY